MAIQSTLFRMAERVVGGDLGAFLRARRADGESYASIASDLRAEHDFEVNAETLRRWARHFGVDGFDGDGEEATA